MKQISIILLFGFSIACYDQDLIIIELNIDKASIPEGIAIHPKSKEIFVSSLHLDKITRSSSDGTTYSDLVSPQQYAYSLGVGMEVVDNQLFALGSIDREKRSMLLQINLENNQLLNRFTLADSIPCYFNDLVIDDQGNVYMTDTEFHKIYKLDATTQKIEVFLEDEQIKYPNGITISEDNSKLFVDSYFSGIRIIDIATHKILNKPHKASAEKGIDGLKYSKGKLYAIINGGAVEKREHGLYQFTLLNKEKGISDTATLILHHKLMNLATTFDIVEEYVYILANSQMENWEEEQNKIIATDSLTSTYVLKLKVNYEFV